jgi:RNA polymerase sigma-70 factor (ECF subfamily)
VQEALARLDEEQRTIILLRDIQDLSYEEISEILDLPRGTVKSRLHRARAELTRFVSRTIKREDVFE